MKTERPLTPSYMRNADRAYRARRIKQGWKYLRIFAPASIIEELQVEYRKLKSAHDMILKIEVSQDGGKTKKTVYQKDSG